MRTCPRRCSRYGFENERAPFAKYIFERDNFERDLSTQDAVDCATQALEKYNIEKDIAAYIKKEFDKK